MNWYKESQSVPIQWLSFSQYPGDVYGEMGISFNGGQKYIYKDVSFDESEKIRKLLRNKNYSFVNKLLRNISDRQKKEDTKEDKEEILNELYEREILS